MDVRYTSFMVRQLGTVVLKSDNPYTTSGMHAMDESGWTFRVHHVSDRAGRPYTVIAVHHDVTGRALGAYEFAGTH
jgi:hypothetical protein